MKRFNFRLNKVLDYRQTLKKESERELAKKNIRLKELEGELEGIIEAQNQAQVNTKPAMTMAEFSLVESYQELMQEKLVETRELVKKADQEVEEARIDYIEKAKDSAVLEKLKDRRWGDYREETRKQERKDLNEMTIQRRRLTKPAVTGGENK